MLRVEKGKGEWPRPKETHKKRRLPFLVDVDEKKSRLSDGRTLNISPIIHLVFGSDLGKRIPVPDKSSVKISIFSPCGQVIIIIMESSIVWKILWKYKQGKENL